MANSGNIVPLNVIVIPTYRESDALPLFLGELLPLLNKHDLIVISDDSPEGERNVMVSRCADLGKLYSIPILFSFTDFKSGRGSAVRRGMKYTLENFPTVETFIECDADGSHRPIDVVTLKEYEVITDMLVGSRYTRGSEIHGWPISRRVFSRVINFVIPKALNLQLKDVTNGLRRYSKTATRLIVDTEQKNSGFIYLSEQAAIISRGGCKMDEIPIIFVNRIAGTSTVTAKEVVDSVLGVINLLFSHRKR